MSRKILFFFFVIGFSFSINAQLSDLHYLPPLKQGQNNAGIREQAVYLSTPEPTTFTVNAYRGTNTTPVATFNISNVSPAVYSMSNGDNNIILVNNANTGVVLNNSGLRFESPSGNQFYVNYRGNSQSQAASLTSKGRQALGQRFKWGGVPNLGSHSSKSNTLGIMATEDNTTIRLFGYDPGCEFRVGNNRAGITADTYTVTLDANESFVFETYIGTAPTQAHEDGWIGATVESDKDIVISNGSINFGRQVNASNRDAGIDQPVPENKLGKDYVFVRGNGNTNGWTEFPLLIAIADNTQIFVNGNATPIATIDEGDYYEVPSSYFSSNTVGANMFVQTSKDVYAYQCMAGASQVYTQGLNFVAPVNCLLPDVMDNIPDIRNMAGQNVTGGMTIIAAVNTPDANIIVTDGNGPVTLPAHVPVAGSADWKTFFVPNLNGNVSVQSTGPMAVGFFGYNGARGVAGYFSGFDTVPEVILEIRGGSGCFVGSEIFEATGNFDAYQWFEDGVAIPGANAPSYAPSGAGDFFVRGTKGPCTYDSNSIRALYCDPDIVINKSVDRPEIMEGETATFTIQVRNLGIGPLTNLQVTDNIPAGLSFISAFTIDGSWSGNTWTIGTLDGGETAELEITVRGDEIDTLPLLNITNTATHTQDQTDTNISEDIPSASVIVHNDFDNDGVRDITDLDDDNDGIYDADECGGTICFETIVNESFENPVIPGATFRVLSENDVPGWFTTATDGQIELWSDNFQGVPAFNGNQFAELNANQSSALYQNLCLTPGTVMNWSLRHRGREGTDVMRVRIGADLASATEQAVMSDDDTAWGLYTGTYTVPMGQTNTVFIFEAVSTAGGSLSVGNFIDDIKITIANVPVCADTDNDGLPDNLDLDSDGDGCSDANEFYKDDNADGGDGGEYGSGTPNVDPNDGTVNDASYVQVLAPEILLGNTAEDLSGNDINGQDVSLGQTFEYVLRFQNTGDDDAVNYTIRDILPANVTFNTVDVSNAPGVIATHDPVTNEITFQVPDGLVEVGDPEYSIRIEVTIALNCSDFVAACSSTLENLAYSTYQGETNSATFTDENGSTSITACARTPEVASNSILNDLTNCDQARTVQLCGDDVLLAAGSGFTSYNWVLDTNGNGQVDGTDTALNDGDPDGDPSTFLATQIGDYIVEKSAGGACPDLVERITVERFGTTQTNPIVDYFNQVNSDANPDNDMQGEIVTCSIDGDLLPKIFLCGATDEATIQLGITDAQSITWEKLDETSCSDTGDDCANKNGTCTWNAVATSDNFTLTESGEFRVVINYQNGCFSRFYFNVFKNELDIDFTSSDILCNTPGNIRITNVGSGYGFQLVDAMDNDNPIVPYNANNGPNFDITTSGTYKVQITQLDPITGDPITGGCIFETPEIGIQERNFSVDISTTPADCNDLGTITVQALNALPNYSYELRLDDGSNGGQGSLVSNQPALNADTYTFINVNPEDYLVITRTQDGCFDSQEITVTEIDDPELSAVVSEHITCNSGIVTVTPSNGLPDPDYNMAIWSRDGVDLYPSPPNLSDIPAANIQTTNNFLFRDGADAGDYQFIVFDSSGCYAISNTVTVEFYGSPVITASNSDITCSDSSTATLTVGVTGGTAPYQYSLDGGATYQNSNTFFNLSAGIYTITVMDSSGTSTTNCVESIDYEIVQPFRLTASATIIEDASCNPAGALVKILNPNGGQAPYEFSFDGGSSFNTVDTQNLLPGTYQLVLQDALGCTFDMDLTVPTTATDPSFTQAVAYDCDGLGTITINPSNTTDFTYSYTLNGTLNTPSDNNIFADVTDGTQTVTVGYSSSITPEQSTLFNEDFGAGPTTQIGEIGAGYCYEPQDGSATACNLGPAGILVDGEYAVTNFVTNPIPAYRNPNDHSGLTDGRFLAINPSNNLVGSNSVIWARRGLEVLPNRDITITFFAYNLRQTGSAGNNPEIEVRLLDAGGTLINSAGTAEIPKNNNADDWHERTVTFNPGANTQVDIVLISSQLSDDGNELILDDIQAFQLPEICEKTTDITVVVEDNQEFTASLLGITDPSCNGSSDGAIRFEVSNFDAASGFEYSTDGTTWTTSLTSPVTTTSTLADGNYTLQIRKVDDTSCTTDITAVLTEPSAIVPALTQTAAYTCFNTGGTLEASASGGNPSYEYQLETTGGAIVTAYQTTTQFTNVTDGDYIVRVRDQNGCEVALSLTDAVTIAPPANLTFNVTPTACYSGTNDGSILVDVTLGNGNYEFRIDSGPWITPTPSTATSHTFMGLSAGSYAIEVRDQLGCPTAPNTQTVIINPQLVVDVDVIELSACNDGSITVNATGGNGTLLYAIVPANTSPTGLFSTTNSLTIDETMATANPGGYDVYVQDNNGSPALCTYMEEDIILTPVPTLSVTATPADPLCFNGLGAIDISVSGGTAPYTYTLTDLSSGDGIDYGRNNTNISTNTLEYAGIGVGDYEVTITDANGCNTTSSTVTINNATEITADIIPILPAACASTVESDFGFEFTTVDAPSGTIQYSNDGGTTWQASTELRGTVANPTFSGTEVFPSIRVEVAPGVFCQKDFDRYIIPFPLDNLDISISAIVVNCNELQVRVQGTAGVAPYEYTFSEDPSNFDPLAATWQPGGTVNSMGATVPAGHGRYTWTGLTPGRTYVFYVRDDTDCVRQSLVNVNDLITPAPVEISTTITPTCDSAANGEITFTLNPSTAYPSIRWEIYELGNPTPIEVSGGGPTATNVAYTNTITTTNPLAEGDYYIEVTQVDGSNVDACVGASENAYVSELAPLAATAAVSRDISCNLPGLIAINGISGGGGAPYTYDVTGPVGFTALSGTTDNPVEIPVNSPAGDYTVTLYDQYHCSFTLNTVTMALAPNPTLSVSQDNCVAPITVTAVGTSAAGNLRYAMVNAGDPAPSTYEDNGGVFSNVTPGNYDVYVMDGNGCIAVEANFVVNPVLTANATLTKLLDCTASPDAIITIEILDGSGSYEYSITNTAGAPAVTQTVVPSTNFDYHAPLSGDYTVTIYDTTTPSNTSCDRQFVINVPDRVVPVIDPAIVTSDVSCLGANDGSITIATTNGAAAPYTFEITSRDGVATSIAPTSTTGNSATFTGLGPAVTNGYIITVTGDVTTNNCSVVSVPIPISEPTAITVPTPTIVEFGCSSGNTSNNASITVNDVTPFVQGGSGTFIRYEFIEEDDPNTGTVEPSNVVQSGTATTYIETDPAGGVYTINVYDENGCFGTTTATIAPFDILGTPTIHIDDPVSCTSSGEDISIDVTSSLTSFGTNPTNYEFRQLPSVTYEPAGDNTFNNLTPGTYTFGVRNITTGCEVTITHVVEEPNTFDVNVEKLADVTCFGDDGSIRLTMNDVTYSGSFTWNIFDTNGTPGDRSDDGAAILTGTSPDFGPTTPIAVPAGNYIVEVTQDGFPECAQIRAFSITTPSAPIGLAPIDLTQVGCSNDQGSAGITPTGGQAPYDIVLTNTTTSTVFSVTEVNSNLFQGLGAGRYDVVITDALGCPATFSNVFELLLPDPISGNIAATTLVCQWDTDASVSISLDARNVAASYRYILNNYEDASGSNLLQSSTTQTTTVFDNLGAGFYSITVLDDMDCTFESNIIEIVDPIEPRGMLTTSANLTCLSEAELELSATGGTGPYEWSIDGTTFNAMNETNNANAHLFQNVAPGTYQYFIRDSFNCISTVSNEITLSPIEPLTLDIDSSGASINCNGDSTAVIMATADGGLGNYEYALFSDSGLVNEVRPYQATGTFADLPMGSYYVNVRSEDCETISTEILIEEPTPLVVTPNITDITCNGGEDGSIVLNVSGGTGVYQYAISPNLNQFDSSNIFTELGPDSYEVIVQDSNGCFELIEFEITEPEALEIDYTSTPEICAGDEDGTISLTITGGTAPYRTSLNSNNDDDFVEGQMTFNGLASETYVVFVKDANDCTTNQVIEIDAGANLNAGIEVIYECSGDVPDNRLLITLEDPTVASDVLYGIDTDDPANMVLEPDFGNLSPGQHYITIAHANGCINTLDFEIEDFMPLQLLLEQQNLNEITALVTGGREGYTYYFNDVDNGDDNKFYITQTDTYLVRVVDENGCEATASIFMEFIDIEIPTFFTPDGDSLNDYWLPRNIDQYPNIFIKIFDRYGRQVYQLQDNEEGWDGLYNDTNLPTGDYWYIIKLNGENDQREFIGHFTLYR